MGKKIFVIAGEASGDALGGPLMEALLAIDPSIEFAGVGGDKMQAAGLKSMLPMSELCVMGVMEVLEHLPRLMKLINGVADEIEAFDPDIVVTIDLPDFNFRVAKTLKKRGKCKAKIVHYVAPTVWAWRPGRAKKVAQFLDGLMCLFPFEPDYFTKHGLKAEYVGHPLTQKPIGTPEDAAAFRRANKIAPDAKVLAVMFGSRPSEFAVHAPLFMEAIEIVREQEPSLQLVVPTVPHLHYDALEALNDCGLPSYVVLEDKPKRIAIAAADAALAVSGTVGLELAYAGVPHVIGYKTNILTWLALKMMVKSKYAHLANILLDKPAVPELLQFECAPDKLAAAVLKLFKDKTAVEEQCAAFDDLRTQLVLQGQTPSQKAAHFILDIFS